MDTVYILDVNDDCTKRQLAQALIFGQFVYRIDVGLYSAYSKAVTPLRKYFYLNTGIAYGGDSHHPSTTLTEN